MMKKIFIEKATVILSFFSLASCNRAILIDKSRVLYQQEGYLYDQMDELLFFPLDIKQNFLSQVGGRKAYKIEGYRGNRTSPQYLSDTLEISTHDFDSDTKQNALWNEKIYLCRVKITYALYKHTPILQKYEDIKFDYKGKTYSFVAFDRFKGKIYRINTVDSTGKRMDFSFHYDFDFSD